MVFRLLLQCTLRLPSPRTGDFADDHPRRRRAQDDQGQGGQVRRPSLHRYPRQGAARFRSGEGVQRRQVRIGPRVRRFVDRGVEGHSSVRHAADAGPRYGEHRSFHGRDDAAPHLRRDRARGRKGIRTRSALAREARRGLPQVDRARRHCVFRSGARVLHLRLRRMVGRHVGQLRKDFLRRSALVIGREVRKRQHGTPAAGQGRLFSGAARRFAAGHSFGDVSFDGADGRRSRGAPS